MGCTLAGSLTTIIKDIKRKFNPDYLFIEPFEFVITLEILPVLSMGKRDVDYEIGPVFALIDAPGFEYSWKERRQTLRNYMVGCDTIAITRVDLVDRKRLQIIRNTVKNDVGKDNILCVSIPDQRGIDEVIARLA